jgi:hypothetical protein
MTESAGGVECLEVTAFIKRLYHRFIKLREQGYVLPPCSPSESESSVVVP